MEQGRDGRRSGTVGMAAEDAKALLSRLQALAALLPVFSEPDFRFATVVSGPATIPFFEVLRRLKWI